MAGMPHLFTQSITFHFHPMVISICIMLFLSTLTLSSIPIMASSLSPSTKRSIPSFQYHQHTPVTTTSPST